MIATVYAATLATRNAAGAALTAPGQGSHPAAPLVLALFASRQRAEQRLVEVARAEWDEPEYGLRYAFGPASEWEDARLLAHMRQHGYLATVTEQVVEL